MTDIRIFTLINGQEIIARVVSDEGTCFLVDRPCALQPVQQGPNEYGIALPDLSFADPEGQKRLYKSAISMEGVETPSELIGAYTRRISNIEIVSSLPGQF
jgi:hypothetical protein